MAQQEILEVQTAKLIHAVKTQGKNGKALNMSDWCMTLFLLSSH
jgi:hypothetical protein